MQYLNWCHAATKYWITKNYEQVKTFTICATLMLLSFAGIVGATFSAINAHQKAADKAMQEIANMPKQETKKISHVSQNVIIDSNGVRIVINQSP